jgi:hypothetical protein
MAESNIKSDADRENLQGDVEAQDPPNSPQGAKDQIRVFNELRS